MPKAKAKVLTDRITHPQVVTLAVFKLGGIDKFIDTEDIAQEASRLAPGRFSWRRYPDQINLELVRVYLSDAKKLAHGALVSGSGRRGWTLTSAGLAWARGAAKRLGGEYLGRDPSTAKGGSVISGRRDRELKRLHATAAWKKWAASLAHDISAIEAEDVFRIDSYALGEMRLLKIERTRKLFLDDGGISAFLKHVSGLISKTE